MIGRRLIMLVVVSLVAFSYYVVIKAQDFEINALSELLASPKFEYGCIAEGPYRTTGWTEPYDQTEPPTVYKQRTIIFCGIPEGCGNGFEALRDYSRKTLKRGLGGDLDKFRIECPGDEWGRYLDL